MNPPVGENGDDEFLMLASCTTKRNSQMDVAPVEQDQVLFLSCVHFHSM